MNEYYNKLQECKEKILNYLKQIYKVYGNELLLRLEEYNLLSHRYNCIESSTAIGYIMEEFITSKLEIYTKSHGGENEIKIEKLENSSTNKSSYDCKTMYKDIFVMINIKVEKKGSSNSAISAINNLYTDYVKNNQEIEKAYFVLKTVYDFGKSKRDGIEKKILIENTNGFFIEEVNLSKGHKQDHRNWSERTNNNAGRLLISPKFYKENILPIDKVSYKLTKEWISEIYTNNG